MIIEVDGGPVIIGLGDNAIAVHRMLDVFAFGEIVHERILSLPTSRRGPEKGEFIRRHAGLLTQG
jgi:hypothetical protein